MQSILKNEIRIFFLIILVGILLYAHHLHHPFQFDSLSAIKENPRLNDPAQLFSLEFFVREYFDRGLLRMSLALNATLDGVDSFGYHLANLLIHLINSILVFCVTTRMMETFLTGPALIISKRQIRGMSFFAAMIFLCHPLQTESVIQVISRSELLAATFYLGAFLLFQNIVQPRGTMTECKRKSNCIGAAICILGLFVCGFSVKQTLITLPAMLLLYYLCSAGAASKLAAWLNKWRWVLGTIALLGLTLLFRKLLTDETFLTGPSQAGQWIGRKSYLLTQPSVLVFYYLKLIFFPINLNIDPHITMVSQWGSLRFWSPLLAIIGSVLLAFRVSQSRVFFFCVAWYFIVASPSSSIVTLLDLAAEHRIYLAGLGPVWILSLAWVRGINLFSKSKSQSQKSFLNATGVALTVMILISLSGLTLLRVEVWQTPFRLWQDALKKSPNAFRPHNNLGKAYYEMKEPETAVQHFRKSIAIEPLHPEPHYNLASVLLDFGRNREAELEYRTALRSNPDYFQAYVGLGSALVKNGLPDEAIDSFRQALKSHQRVTDHPEYPVAHLNIGEALARQGRYPHEIQQWQIAVQQQPSLIEAHYNLGTAWLITGELKSAEQAFLTCLKLDAGFDHAHFNLARVYQKQNLWDRANDHLQVFIDQKGPHAGAYFEMAVNHQQAGRFNEAESFYLKSIELDSRNLYANLNLGHLFMSTGKKDLAKTQLQRALSLNPPKNLAAEIKQLLEELE